LATTFRRIARLCLIAIAPLALAGCGINDIPRKQVAAQTAWADVQNNYQRRADLIPNLVATVKGYAAQEQRTLVEVTQARASATQVKVDASTLTNPAAFQQYEQAQNQLSGVLGRLMMIQEKYPDLKSNQNFLALQDATTTPPCRTTTPPCGSYRPPSGRIRSMAPTRPCPCSRPRPRPSRRPR